MESRMSAIIKSPAKRTNCFISTNKYANTNPSSPQLHFIDGFVVLPEQRGEENMKKWRVSGFLTVGKRTKECPDTAKHCMAPGQAFIPELRMAALGLVWRKEPIVAEPLLLLLVVPSPLQVSCREESCPGMVMDLAVEGGLESQVKEVTDSQAGTGNHPIPPAIPTLLSRAFPGLLLLFAMGKAGSSLWRVWHWISFSYMQDSVFPTSHCMWTALQEKASYWLNLRQKEANEFNHL